jgi:hypothetical protein
MNPKARARYDAVLKEAVLTYGTLCDTGSWAYGYIAPDYEALHECRTNCRVYSDHTVREDSWTDFDSFHESSPHRVMDLTGVNCDCGRLVNRTVRWDVSPSEAIEKVFELAFGEDEDNES